MLMGMRGARHRFMPNRLVFPGGRVDRVDLSAPSATKLSARTERLLRKHTNARLAHGLAHAAARELLEETGLSLGAPPQAGPAALPGARGDAARQPDSLQRPFFMVYAEHVTGTLGGDGELDGLRFYPCPRLWNWIWRCLPAACWSVCRIWLAMTEAERDAQTHTPVLLRDRGWRME